MEFLWINEHQSNRAILIDNDGNIIKVIGAPDANTRGCDYSLYGRCGKDIATPYNLCWPGGSIGIDNANNIYLADETTGGGNQRIARFALPYNTYQYNGQVCLPDSNGGLVGDNDGEPNSVSAYKFSEVVGTFTFENQLVVKDKNRYMIWNDYLNKFPGEKADFVVGQVSENERVYDPFYKIAGGAFHVIDDKNRLWTYNQDKALVVYQLPLTSDSVPLKNDIKLYWINDPNNPIGYYANSIAFDKINKKIWVSDLHWGYEGHRLFRIKNYDEFNNKLYVDAVIGQPNKESVCCNQATKNEDGTCPSAWTARDIKNPTANSLCLPYDMEFDNLGNLYVVENNYEGHGNIRMTVFMAENLASIPSTDTVQFPLTKAKKVFGPSDFTTVGNWPSFVPIVIAFNSKNNMVAGTDGYYNGDINQRHLRQLLFYKNPLQKDSNGNYIQGQEPDSYIKIPMGAPGEINFDDDDNLIVQDHTWSRVLVSGADPNKFYIKSQGQNVAWFGDRGNIVLKGPCQVKPTCTPPADSFIFKNSAGDTVAYIGPTGYLCIETGDCSSSTSCSATSNDEFIMQDETGKVVSKIDLSNGDLCYTGKMVENGEV